ncbi:MAG: NAD-dependent epimerase/dehydratase family protein, partial [Cytophagales bacterium]|nr:NAD-dependent epimerase/dehydratase family protein [Cytophagales bacterium]
MEHRILITGATGFIGSHIIPYFTSNYPHWKLFVLVRSEGESHDFPSGVGTIHLSSIHTSLSLFGITDIVHLAGKAHDTSKNVDPSSYFKANLELTKDLFNVFKDSTARTFVFLSSIKSIQHSSSVVFDENHREIPRTPYGLSKKQAEEYIASQFLSPYQRYFILRPVLVYGKGVKGNLKSLVKLVKRGIPYPFSAYTNKRSYLSVNNLSYVTAKLIDSDLANSEVFNLCDDYPLSTSEIIQLLSRKMGKKAIMIPVPKFCWNFLATLG